MSTLRRYDARSCGGTRLGHGLAALAGVLWLLAGVWALGGDNQWTKVGAFGGDIPALVAGSDGTLYAATMGHGVYRTRVDSPVWTPAGIDGTTLRALSVDPSQPGVIYAVTDWTIWRTLDGGVSWSNLGAGLCAVARVCILQTVAVAPLGNAAVFVGTLDNLYRSDDGGVSWVKAGAAALDYTTVSAIAFHPTDPNTLYVGTANGVYRSPDRGGSWVWASGGFPVSDRRVTSLAVLATNPPKLFVTKTEGLLASSDDGESWSLVDTGIDLSQRWAMTAADPRNPGTVYVAYEFGARRSDDGGRTWQDVSRGLPTVAFSGFAFPSGKADLVLLGSHGGGVSRSEAGAPWRPAYSGLPSATITSVAVADTAPATAFVATDGAGLFASRDGGASWAQVGAGMTRTDVLSVAVDPRDPTRALAGTRQGVFLSSDSGTSWGELLNAGASLRAENIAIDPIDSSRFAVVSQHWYWLSGGLPQRIGGLFLTENGGRTWREGFTAWGPWLGVPALAFDHLGALFLAGSFGVYRLAGANLAGGEYMNLPYPLSAIALDPRRDATIYVGGRDGIFKTTDGAVSWSPASQGLGDPSPWNTVVRALVVDLAAPERLYAATRLNGVWRTLDGAATWVPASFGLPLDEITSLAVGREGQLYAGTRSSGVFAARFPDEPARPVRPHLRPSVAPVSAWPGPSSARRPS